MNTGWIGLRLTTGHALAATILAPAMIAAAFAWGKPAVGITAAVSAAVIAVLTIRGRRLTGWIAALYAWRRRHKTAPPPPGDPVVGKTVLPGDHVALRWEGDELVAAIELIPHPFTPTVIVNGEAHTDDVIDTRLVEELLAAHCPEIVADVVSAGYRVGRNAPPSLVNLYEQVVGPHPAPAHRRSWVILRANAERCRKSSQRRDSGVSGLARYLVASTTRIADQLAGHGVDARCARSFDDYDHAVEISFERETWSMIKGRSTFTTAYTAAGGPDVWWSARADHTITRVRIEPGEAPRATVLLTTLASPKTPRGFSCLYGGQRAALSGHTPVADRHHRLPIGSAGVLVGETGRRFPVYMPFDDVDCTVNVGDARLFTQFVVRSAAAGARVVLGAHSGQFAGLVNGRVGQTPRVVWPNATTYLVQRPGVARILLRDNFIGTPRHRQLPIQLVEPREESRYQMALEGRS